MHDDTTPTWPPLPLLQAPPLYQPPQPIMLADDLLLQLDEGEPVVLSEDDRDRRLGHVFERWLLQCLQQHPYLDVCAHNLAIRRGGRTLGELDLVVHDRRNDRFEHWEMTVKFYLGLHDGIWPGPNPADQFQHKAHHLFTHQFPLSDRSAARHCLADLGVPRIDGKRLLSRGALFYPADRTLAAPAGTHPLHTRGLWWSNANLPAHWQWLPLRREQWLGMKPLSDKGTSLLASTDVLDYVRSVNRPVMVLGVDPNRPVPQSGFIVSEQWLADAQTSAHSPATTD
ncbi:MAG: DUF1853 family protein [Alcanivoracaceae bacterium]|nr:DUF1853 family protein [Alcanivoracaceae bacterium]